MTLGTARRTRVGALISLVVAPVAVAVGVTAPDASAAPTPDVRFDTADIHSWEVPEGVTSIDVELAGQAGENSSDNSGEGGKGAVLVGSIAVEPGKLLTIAIDRAGAAGVGGDGLFADGGSGGRASSITIDGTIVMMAGGGGGGGAGAGGSGGDGGGSGLIGKKGSHGAGVFAGLGGGAASTVSDGAGGAGSAVGLEGGDGDAFGGGAGGVGGYGGGGGGAGWRNGGGGGGSNDDGAGGGGAGSSYVDGDVAELMDLGENPGPGYLNISYDGAAPTTTTAAPTTTTAASTTTTVAGTTTTTVAIPGQAELPHTGRSTGPLFGVAVACLALGVGLVWRRRAAVA